MIKVKLLQKHSKDCLYVKNKEENRIWEWYFQLNRIDEPEIFFLDAAGGKRGTSYKWLAFHCNAGCGAHGIVRVDSIATAIQEALEKQS